MATFIDKENHVNLLPTKNRPVAKPLTPVTKKKTESVPKQATPKPIESETEQKLKLQLQEANEIIEQYRLAFQDAEAEKDAQLKGVLRREPKRVRIIHELKNERDFYKQKYEEVSLENEVLKANIEKCLSVEQNYALSSAF